MFRCGERTRGNSPRPQQFLCHGSGMASAEETDADCLAAMDVTTALIHSGEWNAAQCRSRDCKETRAREVTLGRFVLDAGAEGSTTDIKE